MNKTFRLLRVRIALACLLVTTGIGALGAANSSTGASAAPAYDAPRLVPLDVWSSPQNLSNYGEVDSSPSIAVTSNGAVTIGWERQQISSPGATYVQER